MNTQPIVKEKRQLSEAQLEKLKVARQKALEFRQRKAAVKRAEKEEELQAFNKAYEEKVLKKKTEPELKNEPAPKPAPKPEVEETDEPIYEQPAPNALDFDDDEEDEYEAPKPAPKPRARPASQPKSQQQPNYKQMYYAHKLQMLQAQQEQAAWMNQYSRQSPYVHATDLARESLTKKMDKAVLSKAFADLFSPN